MASQNVSAAIRRAQRSRSGATTRAKARLKPIRPGKALQRAYAAGSPDLSAAKNNDIINEFEKLEPGDAIEFVDAALESMSLEIFTSLDDAAMKRTTSLRRIMRMNYATPSGWPLPGGAIKAGTFGIFIGWRRAIVRSHHMRFGNIEWAKFPIVFVRGIEYALDNVNIVKRVT